MRNFRMRSLTTILFIAVWILAACAPASLPATEPGLPAPKQRSPAVETSTAPELPIQAPTDQPEVNNVPATATEAPVVSPELHATDPSSVNLASGQVQLVEFFAFW